MNQVLIGIDAGTTTIKTVAFTEDGTEIARTSRENSVIEPQPNWAEQDMNLIWAHTSETIQETVDLIPENYEIAAVGITGQGGGCWLVDDTGKPIRNAIIWTDSRAADIVDEWRKTGIHDGLFEQFGYGVFPGLALPILQWFMNNEVDTLRDADTLLGCKDWIRYRLTDNLASDPTELSLIHFDPTAEQLDTDLPKNLRLPFLGDLAPPIESPTTLTGKITSDAAAETGLPEGTPVATGVFDVAASAFGSGVATPGDSSTVVGTTLQIQKLLEIPQIDPPAVGYTLALGINGMGLRAMGAMTGTPNLDWARETIADGKSFEDVESIARTAPSGADGVVYHPYLSTAGEKAPFIDPNARAGFTGLNPSHERAHLLRAIYEGLALSLRDCAEGLPGEIGRTALSGGGTRSTLLCELFANCLDTTVVVPVGEEFGAKGAATLAAIAIGLHNDLKTAVSSMTSVEKRFCPSPEQVKRYDSLYDIYTEIAAGLREPWQHRASLISEWES